MLLRSVPMVHMQIQVPSRDAAVVTHCIAAQGLLHLVDIAHGRVTSDHPPTGARQSLAGYRDLSQRVRRVAERLGIDLQDVSGSVDASAPADLAAERGTLEAALGPIEAETNDVWTSLREARDRLSKVTTAIQNVSRLADAGVPLDRLADLRFLSLRLGLTPVASAADIASLSGPAAVAVVPLAQDEGKALVAVATARGMADRIEAALRLVPFESIDARAAAVIPAGDIDRARAEAEERVGTSQEALATIAKRVAPEIRELWRRAELGVLLLQAQLLFAVTGRFLVIAGWIPADHADALAARIADVSERRAIVTIERPEDMPEVAAQALHIPILHRNPVLLRPFESLVQLYGTPTYREVQPTAFFAISFLLMFGLMFGDVGHGATLFAAGYSLYRWVPRFLDYGILLMEVGCASALFGLLYGSFFGIEGLLPVLWMEPVRDLPRFMVVAVSLGVVLITAGFVLNVINNWRAGERATAVFGLHGVFGAFLYWSILALAIRFFKPVSWTVAPSVIWVLLLTAVALIACKGPLVNHLDGWQQAERRPGANGPFWLGALEASVELVDALVSFFANTVSFVRIAAFAAVHAGVFIAMFALADTLGELRFGGLLSVLALVAGNVVIILLEGLTVSVQVLRLEYYEFFGKFFRGGGEVYRPLMLSTKGNS
jgi:V/A-type H+-transporting ATPase subunit I